MKSQLRVFAGLALALAALVVGGSCRPDEGSVAPPLRTLGGGGFFDALPLPALDYTDLPVPPAAPCRVVSLVASVTEVIWALGMGDRMIGRSHWCDWPLAVRELPNLGRQESFSKERIADLRPDLVILFRSQVELARGLRDDFGLEVLAPPTEGCREIFAGIADVAVALGVPERGARLVASLRGDLEVIRERYAAGPRPRVLLVLERDPLWVVTPASFVGDLLEIAGGHNVVTVTDAAWAMVTVERVLDWNPEIILDLAVGDDREGSLAAACRFWQRYTAIDAVRRGQVLCLQTGVLTRPGPRMAAVAGRLAEALHAF